MSHALLLVALAAAWKGQSDPAGADAALFSRIVASVAWLTARAADHAGNFLHLLHLVQAELAWARGDRWTATAAFDRAMTQVRGVPRPWHRALICERAARFHLWAGTESAGRHLMAFACGFYDEWGATAKARRLEEE